MVLVIRPQLHCLETHLTVPRPAAVDVDVAWHPGMQPVTTQVDGEAVLRGIHVWRDEPQVTIERSDARSVTTLVVENHPRRNWADELGPGEAMGKPLTVGVLAQRAVAALVQCAGPSPVVVGDVDLRPEQDRWVRPRRPIGHGPDRDGCQNIPLVVLAPEMGAAESTGVLDARTETVRRDHVTRSFHPPDSRWAAQL